MANQQFASKCKGCGIDIIMRRIHGNWHPYEPDPTTGAPVKDHACAAYAAGIRAGTIPAPSAPVAAPVTHTATQNPQPTATATAQPNPTATAQAAPVSATEAAPVIDIAGIYDDLRADDMRSELATDHVVKPNYADVSEDDARHDDTGAIHPVIDPDYMIDATDLAIIHAIIADANDGEPQNIGLYGPKGSGKTTLAHQIAALRGSPLYVCEAADKEVAASWYAETTGIDTDSGRIEARASAFVRGIETKGATVLINDVALLGNPTVQNGLNELLDPTSRGTFAEILGRRIHVAPGVIIVATFNVGYSGAMELSEQLLDRLASGALFEVPYADMATLARIISARTGLNAITSYQLAHVTQALRDDEQPFEVSTRELISAARKIVRGMPVGMALSKCVLGQHDDSQRARAFGIISIALGTLAPEYAITKPSDRRAWDPPKRLPVPITTTVDLRTMKVKVK